ncbi:MAG: hypothetical protein ACQETQ_07775 [Spirochaetota bacterium]
MKRYGRTMCLAAAVFALIATTPLGAEEHEEFLYRYGLAPGTEVSSLSDEPDAIEFEVVEDPEFSSANVSSIAEYHGVYPLSAQELLNAVTAYGDYTRISKRVTESEVLESPEEPPYDEIGTVTSLDAARMLTSFKFLFFGREYEYTLSSMTEELDDGALLVRSRMSRSLDGGLAAIHYSWYLEPVGSGEETRTYLRYFTRTDFAEEPRGLRKALDLFAKRDIERLLESLYEYARREG